MEPTQTPTLLGVDVLWVATILAAIAAGAVLVAIYAALSVRDPMAKRVKALNDRRAAFENFAHRVALDEVKGIVTTMVQTEKYGTPLASALRVLSAEFRNERMMRAEEKAARLPAIMTVPLILFILPVLFIVILGPAACSISDSFVNGNI